MIWRKRKEIEERLSRMEALELGLFRALDEYTRDNMCEENEKIAFSTESLVDRVHKFSGNVDYRFSAQGKAIKSLCEQLIQLKGSCVKLEAEIKGLNKQIKKRAKR